MNLKNLESQLILSIYDNIYIKKLIIYWGKQTNSNYVAIYHIVLLGLMREYYPSHQEAVLVGLLLSQLVADGHI